MRIPVPRSMGGLGEAAHGVLIAAGDGEDPRQQDPAERVHDARRISPIGDRGSKPFGNAHPPCSGSQKHHAPVR